MPRKPGLNPPKYRVNKRTGRATVRIDGHDYGLGTAGTPESHTRYSAIIAQWRAGVPVEVAGGCTRRPDPLAVCELIERYTTHAEGYYRKAGQLTSEIHCIRSAVLLLNEMYGMIEVAEFTPLKLQNVRESMILKKWTRGTINKQVGRLVSMFKWGVGRELVPVETYQGLAAVEGLRAGRRADVRETARVESVSIDDVEATKAYLTQVLRDMIDVQLLTGARPGEVISMRPGEIQQEGDAWTYRPGFHKTQHHGKDRIIFIGPRAQLILRKYLDSRLPGSPVFSPREAITQQHEDADTHRRPDQKPNLRRTARRVGAGYTRDSYRRAIQRAAVKAGVPAWHPHQLRHTRATELERTYGRDDARVVLGHSDLKTTDIYIDRDMAKARRIMAEVG